MKSLFQPRLPSRLTLSQITKLSNQSNLSFGEIEEWYKRFIFCYPYGYVSFEEFIIYIKQLNIHNGHYHNSISKLIIKQLFYTLSINKNKKLNFEEFFGFNLLINHGSDEDKLKLILKLYDEKQKIYYTQQQIVDFLIDMFNLFNFSKSITDLSQRIDRILTHINVNEQNIQICWKTFCTSVLNDSSLLLILLLDRFDNEKFEGNIIV